MPNHVSHRFTVTASTAAELDAFLERVKGEDTPFTFQSIVPMPEVTRSTVKGSQTEAGLAIIAAERLLDTDEGMARRQLEKLSWLRHHWDSDSTDVRKMIATLKERWPNCVTEGEALAKSLEETGYPTWYEWALVYWGTKWNAYQVELTRVTDTEADLAFDTAWSPPTPVLKKLAEEHPEITMKGACIDEGWNFAGKLGFESGEYYDHSVECKNTPEFVEMYVAIYGDKPKFDEEGH